MLSSLLFLVLGQNHDRYGLSHGESSLRSHSHHHTAAAAAVPSASDLNLSSTSASGGGARRPMTAPGPERRAHSRTHASSLPNSPFSASAAANYSGGSGGSDGHQQPPPPAGIGGGAGGGLDATMVNSDDTISAEIREKYLDIDMLRKRQLQDAFSKVLRLENVRIVACPSTVVICLVYFLVSNPLRS